VPRTNLSAQTASERESLEAGLDFHRDTLMLTCEGLSAEGRIDGAVGD
jgi:hypothetical protein